MWSLSRLVRIADPGEEKYMRISINALKKHYNFEFYFLRVNGRVVKVKQQIFKVPVNF